MHFLINMKYHFVLIENLPPNATWDDIHNVFKNFGIIQRVYQFRYTGKKVYDLQAAVIDYQSSSFDQSQATKMTSGTIVINGHVIQTTMFSSLVQFKSTAIIMDVTNIVITNRIKKIAEQLGCFSLSQVASSTTDPSLASAHIASFLRAEDCQKFISELKDIHILPLIGSRITLGSPAEEFSPDDKMCNLRDFTLRHLGRSYKVYRSTASVLSATIDKCPTAVLDVPNIRGPFHMITDFLELKDIIITPETVRFLAIMSTFLQIPGILNSLDTSGDLSTELAKYAAPENS